MPFSYKIVEIYSCSQSCNKNKLTPMCFLTYIFVTLCNKIDKPLVVYRFTGNVMTSITTSDHNDKIITLLRQK